jgi:integrase
VAKPKPVGFVVRKSRPFKGKEWRVIGYEDGKRKQFWFASEKEAKKDAADRNEEREAYGTKINLDSEARYEAAKAADLLRPYGKTILDAVHFYRAHLDKEVTSISVSELCTRVKAEFQRRLEKGEASKKHFTTMGETLRYFEGKFATRGIKTLSGTEIKAWLAHTSWKIKTRNRYLGYIKNIFGIAKDWGLVSVSPLSETNGFHDSRRGVKVEILAPDEMTRFLVALDSDWIPFFSLNAFTGLRPEEISRLDWSEVKLDRSLIDLPMEKSKNKRRKLIEVPDNLKAFLTSHVKPDGPVIPKKKLQLAREKAVEKSNVKWKQNCLRHSFCSYAVAIHGLEWTADQADHDIRILKRDYREKVTKEDAEKYWAILP